MQIPLLALSPNPQVSSGAGVTGTERNSRPVSSESACRHCFTGDGYEFAQETVSMKVRSNDGDMLELTYASQVLKGVGSFAGQRNSTVSLVDVVANIKEFIKEQQGNFIEILMEKEGDSLSKAKNGEVGASEPSVLNVPEYWNAENTSQRIVDFAVSFYGLSGKDADEFGKELIEAVEEGFKQARGILGSLPDEVNGLISDTEALTLEKLNAWVAQTSAVPETAAA